MDASNGPSKNTLLMMFGLPIVTTFIVCTSMYVGHILTKKMDRPTQVVVQPSTPQISFTAPAPNVDVHVPAPAVNVMPSTAQVTVIERQNQHGHPVEKASDVKPVPMSKPVERSTQQQIPLMLQKREPQKTNSTKIESGEPTSESRTLKQAAPAKAAPVVAKAPVSKPVPVAASAPVVTDAPKGSVSPASTGATASSAATVSPVVSVPTAPATPTNGNSTVASADVRPAPAPVVVTPKPNVAPPQPMITASVSRTSTAPAATSSHASETAVSRDANEGRLVLASAPRTTAAAPVSSSSSGYLLGRAVRDEELNLDVFYTLCRKYVDAYCVKMGLNPHEEHAKWTKKWNANLEQAMYDGSDSSEQQYINRQTISKRDCFNIEKSSADKIAEGCRILLRYRDGGFTWLSAMTNALTQENLRKTIDFLNAGPRL